MISGDRRITTAKRGPEKWSAWEMEYISVFLETT